MMLSVSVCEFLQLSCILLPPSVDSLPVAGEYYNINNLIVVSFDYKLIDVCVFLSIPSLLHTQKPNVITLAKHLY